MLEVSEEDIRARTKRDNPWWSEGNAFRPIEDQYKRRAYFPAFLSLVETTQVRRAAILVGPRRVGKTVMLMQVVSELLGSGVPSDRILYASIDAPIFANTPLEKFLSHFPEPPVAKGKKRFYVIFDEIQYLKDWEIHLKDLVDNYPAIKFIASGSAAAALKRASQESGAGRFSDFRLPPMTFAEFLDFTNLESSLIEEDHYIDEFENERLKYTCKDINKLNEAFIDYLNFGGYPEAVLNPEIRRNSGQYLKNDIIEKVLLKDLPNLYGIRDIQELNSLFSHLAYNTGQEVSLQALAQKSGISKPTISKYISYLESAFLLLKVSRIDRSAGKLKKEMTFKVYLTNPSMRAALFSPVSMDQDEQIGHLAESAVFSQWAHADDVQRLHYARWSDAEIDIVYLDERIRSAEWAVEIKWSDRILKNPKKELKGLLEFLRMGKVEAGRFTTKTQTGVINSDGSSVPYGPCSLYCYTVGKNVVARKTD